MAKSRLWAGSGPDEAAALPTYQTLLAVQPTIVGRGYRQSSPLTAH
jgi:hypothetical protein